MHTRLTYLWRSHIGRVHLFAHIHVLLLDNMNSYKLGNITTNITLRHENVGLGDKNVGLRDENVGVGDENVGLRDENKDEYIEENKDEYIEENKDDDITLTHVPDFMVANVFKGTHFCAHFI